MQNDAFKALSDMTRRRILEMLAAKGELSAGEIASGFDMSAPSISHHLAILRSAGLVLDTRQGQSILYRFNRPVVLEVGRWFEQVLDDNAAGTGEPDAKVL